MNAAASRTTADTIAQNGPSPGSLNQRGKAMTLREVSRAVAASEASR